MPRFLLSVAVLAACSVARAQMPEQHLQEAGSAVVLAHSTFAHGYRHGYEEGYHGGNTDVNMGRTPRSRLSDIRDLKSGYSSEFGPRRIFDRGFQAGLKAGYGDGYSGRTFRAVDTLRSVGEALGPDSFSADPAHVYFDQGFLTGYDNGLASAASNHSSVAQMDFHHVSCEPFHPARQHDLAAAGSYCEGYRRGFALGYDDGFVLGPAAVRMEASK
jgi:hypothetical protein